MKNFLTFVATHAFVGALLWIGAFQHPGGWSLAWVVTVLGLVTGAVLWLGYLCTPTPKLRKELLEKPKQWRFHWSVWVAVETAFALFAAWHGRPVLCLALLLWMACGRVLLAVLDEERAKAEADEPRAGARGQNVHAP